MRKIVLTVVLIGLVAAAGVPAFAAKGGGKGKNGDPAAASATIALDQTPPHYGDVVTFTVAAGSVREDLSVWLHCDQGGSTVFQFVGLAADRFPLGGPGVSSPWAGGPATCVADLYYYTLRGQTQTSLVTLASTTFDVAG
jgi:hypothetical protein